MPATRPSTSHSTMRIASWLLLALVIALAIGFYLYTNSSTPYNDPANRFSLRLPRGWTADKLQPYETHFLGRDNQRFWFSDSPAASENLLQATELALDDLGTSLSDFTLTLSPEPAKLGSEEALYTEYQYTDEAGSFVLEAAYFTLNAGRLQGLRMATQEATLKAVRPVLQKIAKGYAVGPHPDGYVPPQTLSEAGTVHHAFEGHFEMEVSELWPVSWIADDLESLEAGPMVRFMEVGGKGQFQIERIQIPTFVQPSHVVTAWMDLLQQQPGTYEVRQERNRRWIDAFNAESFLVYRPLDDQGLFTYVTVMVAGAHAYVIQILYPDLDFYERRPVFDAWIRSINIPI